MWIELKLTNPYKERHVFFTINILSFCCNKLSFWNVYNMKSFLIYWYNIPLIELQIDLENNSIYAP